MVTTLASGLELPSDQEASGRMLGREEMVNLAEVIASGILTSSKGRFVKELEEQFAEMLGVEHVYACSSGTAAIHAAVAALDPEPGDEIVTSPITDMGALAPILYQAALPVFAEVDLRTWNVTAKAIEPCLSERFSKTTQILRGSPLPLPERTSTRQMRRPHTRALPPAR